MTNPLVFHFAVRSVMNTRVVAFEEVSPATVQRRSIWTTVLSCLLIVHAALLISEVLTGPGWLAWVECIVASLFGLVGLRERASEAEPKVAQQSAQDIAALVATPAPLPRRPI
jgi:hypothetical protein